MVRPLFLSVFGILYFYLTWSLFGPYGSPLVLGAGAVGFLSLFAAILWIPLVHWQLELDETTVAQRFVLWIGFVSIGWLSFLLVLTLGRDLAWAVGARELRTATSSSVIFGAALVFLATGFLIAQFGVRAKRVRVVMPGLPAALEGFRIVQISDVHVGPTIRRSFVKKMVRIVNESHADVVVATGDIADGMPGDLAEIMAPFSDLQAKHGKFYVTGNHEYYWAGPQWVERMRELGFTPLENDNRTLQIGSNRIAFAGVTDPAAKPRGPDFKRASRGIDEGVFPRVLLVHQPRFAAEAASHGFDLQISGHTHGGQFFPWTLFTARVHQFNHGLHRLGNLQVYVSRGTGYWGPPVRLGAPPEITVLELHSS